MGSKNAPISRRSGRRSGLIIVAAFLVLLVVQGFYSFRVSPEPYPVIRMPGFAGAASVEGTRPVTFVEGAVDFSDGTTVEVDPAEVMKALRFSTARPTLDHVFDPTETRERSPELLAWLREQVEGITGRTDADAIRFCWQKALVHVEDASVTDRSPCEWTEVDL